MNLVPCSGTAFVIASILALVCSTGSVADDSESSHQLTLADLAAYRAALSGKATGENAKTSDPPLPVAFSDLWNHPDAFRGRRVTIHGRLERTFRQGPIGSFPALAEVWIVSPAGDPFCVVVPHDVGTSILALKDSSLEDRAAPTAIPEPGQKVQFTGTFLKLVRYAGGDGARLAPLIVGAQPPMRASQSPWANETSPHSAEFAGNDVARSRDQRGQWVGSTASWLLVLTLAILATMLAWHQARAPLQRSIAMTKGRNENHGDQDPLLEFLQSHEEL